MQNKFLVKLFAWLFGIVSIYQLSFTYIANRQENKAEEFAIKSVPSSVQDYNAKREILQRKYLDSINNEVVYNLGFAQFTYKDVKENELSQGLDLKGGINVVLQVSVKDILKELSDNSKNPILEKSLLEANKLLRETDKTYLDLFFEAFDKNGGKLSSPDVFGNKLLSDQVNYQMSNSDVKPVIRKKVDESIESAFEVLRKRIDKFGVANPNLQRLGNSGRILVELPGAKDIDRVKNLLQSTAQLEFWETYKRSEIFAYLDAVNSFYKPLVNKNINNQSTQAANDTLATSKKKDSIAAANEIEPVFSLVKLPIGYDSPVIGYFSASDTTKLMSYFNSEDGKRLLPNNMKYLRFAFGKPIKISDINQLYSNFYSVESEKANPVDAKNFRDQLVQLLKKSDLVELYALRGNRENIAPLTGNVVTDAVQTYDNRNKPCVSMNMDVKGAKIWENLTGKVYNEQGNIAIVLDNVVYSAPGVTSGPISGGSSQITGNFTIAEGQDLANVLRAGKLPASADVVQSEVVGPSLGQEAISAGFMSFFIAIAVVFLWMAIYYGEGGIYADVALILNVLLIFGVLASMGAVLTLPGIAGIVLTMGMAVDANVIIFERIKEELRLGKNQAQAVKDGFSNALSSILDANVTTFLTGLVLLVYGSGPIKGFATTLNIGIITTLFTAIFVPRIFIDAKTAKGKTVTFWINATKDFLENVNFNFVKARKKAYIVSAILIVISVASIFTRGFDEGIEFAGGRSYQIRFKDAVKTTEIANAVKNSLGVVEVKTFGAANQVKLTTKYKVQEESTAVDNEIQHILHKDLEKFMGEKLPYEEFMSGEGLGIMKSDKVGPSIAEDIKSSAFYSVLFGLVIISLYILFRFKKWQFSLGAIISLAHDVIIMLGLFSLFHGLLPFNLEIDQSFIAAILTVIGYSINDTVIIYDRIRENVAAGGWSTKHLNHALNSTLTRTVNTSCTTLVVLITIFIFGGDSLRGFMFALTLGVLVGTYSSVFVATPVLFDSIKKEKDFVHDEEE